MVHALRGKPGLQERVSVLRLWGLVPWRSRRMLPTSRSAARACSANPGVAPGLGAQERQGAEAVPRQQKDEGSSAQEPANVREAEERVSPLRVWSFGSGSCQPLLARRPVPPRRKARPGEKKRRRQLSRERMADEYGSEPADRQRTAAPFTHPSQREARLGS